MKNRLKQNKEKFEPTGSRNGSSSLGGETPTVESQNYLITSPTLQSMLLLPGSNDVSEKSCLEREQSWDGGSITDCEIVADVNS